jgi:HSP20 family molecular chaperone IbpA
MGRTKPSPNPAHPDDRSRPSRLGQLERDQRVAHAAPDAGRKRAGQGVPDRAQRLQQRAHPADRSQDRVSSHEIDQAAQLAEDPGQEKDGVVQVLDQKVQPRKGVPKQQVVHAPADLVSVAEDIVWMPHIRDDGCCVAPFPRTCEYPVTLSRVGAHPDGVGPVAEPLLDLLNEGDRLILEIAVPGILESDIDLTLTGTRLILTADRPAPKASYLHREIERGILVRSLVLPFAVELVRSSHEDGVLRLELKRAAGL